MTSSDRQHVLKTELLLLTTIVIWAANYPLAKYAVSNLNMFVFNCIRFIVAAAVIAAFYFSRRRWTPINAGDWKRLLIAGVIAHVVYQITFVVGLSYTTAGNSAVLLSTSPLWTTFLHSRMHREKIAPTTWAGMFISLLGVFLIILGSGKKLAFGSNELAGDVICIAAAALWGLNSNLQKPLLSTYSALELSFVMIAVGAAGLTVAALPALPSVDWAAIPGTVYAATIASGALSIGIGNIIWSYGIKHLGPSKASNFNNLVPVLAFLLSYLLLHEHVLPVQIAGAVITVFGVWIVRR